MSQDASATTVTVAGNLDVTGTISGDGSGLTSLNGSSISSGTVADGRLSGNVVLRNGNNTGANSISGNTNFSGSLTHNGNSVCDTSGNCVGNGSSSAVGGSGTVNRLALFTNSGYTIGDSILSQDANATTLTVAGNLTATGTITAGSFSGNGANVTDVDAATLQGQTASYFTNASNINSGTLADVYLSNNVALYDRSISNFTGILQHAGNDVCDTSGNCVGSSGGGIGGSGSANTIAMFTGNGYNVGNSLLSQDTNNTTVTVGGNLAVNTTATTDNGVSITNSTLTTGNIINITNTSGSNTSGNTANITDTATLSTANQTQSGNTLNVNRNLTANVTTVPSIALDSSKSTAGSTPTSLSVTVGSGSNRYLIVTTSTAIQYGTSTVSSVKYNGISLTLLARQAAAGTETPETAIWGLANPPSGTYTLTATSNGGNVVMTATSWNNVAQANTVDGTYTSHGSSGTLSGTVASTANDLVIDSQGVAYPTGAGLGTPGSGQTQIGRLTSTWIGGNASYKIASGSSTTMTESSAAFAYAYAVVALKMAGGTAFVTGSVANLSSNCTATAGYCVDSSNVLNLQQQYANATGDVLNTSNAGTGAAINIAQTGALASSKAVITVNDTNSASDTLISLQQNGIAQFTVNASGNATATGTITANSFVGNGAGVTNVNAVSLQGNSASYFTNASNISSGTLADGRLSSNVVLRNGNNTGTGSISGNTNFTGTLTHNGNNVCDTSGNCTGVSGGALGGSGTVNTIAMFNGSGYTVTNSLLSQDASATTVTVNGALTATGTITAGTFSGNGSGLTSLNGSSISSGTVADPYVADNLTISSSGNVDWTALTNYPGGCSAGSALTALGDTPTCTIFAAGSGSGNYIQNQHSSAQASADFWISGTGTADTFQAATFDAATAGTLTLGATNATSINLAQNTTLAAGKTITITGGTTTTRPASPTKGMLYYDTTTNHLLQYNGTKWVGSQKQAVIVAASNSSQADKDAADFVATGSNDASTINTALSAAAGGVVYLEKGTYTLGATSISVPNNTTLAGTGNGTQLTYPTNLGSSTYYAIQNTSTSSGTGVTVRDLTIDGNSTNQTSGTFNGIYFSGMGDSATNRLGGKITGVTIQNLKGGAGIILYSPSSYASNNTITGNTINNNYNGITLSYAITNTITGNTIYGNSNAGIYLDTGSYTLISANTIDTNGSGISSATYTNNQYNTITGNTINNNTGTGIYFGSGPYNTVTGNTLNGNGSSAIYFNSGSYNNVSANQMNDNGGSGAASTIYVNGVSSNYNRIADNQITDTAGTGYAILVETSATGTYLANNVFSGTGASSVQNFGIGTVLDGQMTSSTGNFVFRVNTDSTSAFSVQNANGTSAINVDTNANKITLNDATTINSTELIKTTNATAFQIQDASANILFTADTSTGTITMGSATNGVVFTAAGGLVANGTARHTKQIALTAEYAGAVLDASGDSSCSSANNGTMTSSNDSSASYMSYYNWTTPNSTTQCYDVVVRVPLPSDFDGWASSTPLTLQTWSSNTTSATLNIQARDTNNTVESSCNYVSATPASASTWTTYSGCTLTGTYAANGVMVLHIRMSAQNNAEIHIGDLTLSYKSKF